MRFAERRPRTIVGLVLTGLVAVTLPLGLGIALSMNVLSKITLQSNELMANSIAALGKLRDLDQDVISLHRLALQFEEINDPETVSLVNERVASIDANLDAIAVFDSGEAIDGLIDELRSEAQATQARIQGRILTPGEAESPQDRGLRLQLFAGQLIVAVNELSRDRVKQLENEASQQVRRLSLLLAVLVPVTLAMVAVFSSLITKPIRGLLSSIRQLERGELGQAIALRGTPELVGVGTQLDALRQRLLHLKNERSSFFRQVSHELKTPLAGVRLGAEMLHEGQVGPLNPEQHEVVNALAESVSRLDGLIENLLNFNGWEERHSEMSITRFDIDPLLDRLVRRYELPLRRKRVQVELVDSTLELQADRAKLRVCVENLFSNAVKFAPPDSSIALTVWQDDARLGIDVADQGPGVSGADRESIFEPFFQGQASRTAYEPGTGLGLCVARECARAHGGEVELMGSGGQGGAGAGEWSGPPPDRERFGGAYFRIYLPNSLIASEEAAA